MIEKSAKCSGVVAAEKEERKMLSRRKVTMLQLRETGFMVQSKTGSQLVEMEYGGISRCCSCRKKNVAAARKRVLQLRQIYSRKRKRKIRCRKLQGE